MRILVALFVLGLVVLIHEFGHFIVAKISNMRVETFSIGMGPAITSIKKGETNYVIGMIPAGGYVQVTGEYNETEDDDFPEDDPRRYPNRPLLSRLLFAFAGSFMNIFTAIVIMMALFMFYGINVSTPTEVPTISTIIANTPASTSGLKEGDQIIALNGTPIHKWDELTTFVEKNKQQSVEIEVLRNQDKKIFNVLPSYDNNAKKYFLGLTPLMEKKREKLSLGEAFQTSIHMTKKIATLVYDAVKNIITGKTGITDKDGGLTGPVGIIKTIDTTMDKGLEEVIFLISMLSINLVLMNLLPFPAVDGSKILFLLIEGVRGLPIDSKKENLVNFIGFLLLMGLMIYVTINDISSL